jgi:hypothetical protein
LKSSITYCRSIALLQPLKSIIAVAENVDRKNNVL